MLSFMCATDSAYLSVDMDMLLHTAPAWAWETADAQLRACATEGARAVGRARAVNLKMSRVKASEMVCCERTYDAE